MPAKLVRRSAITALVAASSLAAAGPAQAGDVALLGSSISTVEQTAGTVSGSLAAVDQAATSTAGATSATGTALDRKALRRALRRAGDRRPRKLRRATPAWFTPQLERRVRRQGTATAPVDAPLPGEVGIRPGSWMIEPYWCTMNYIFRKGSTLAIGTAGHCLEGGERPVLLTVAPSSGEVVLVELGRPLLKMDGGIGRDYGLVEIPPEHHDWVFPTIAGVGGPCGIYLGGDPQPVAHYGHGLIVGTGGTPRAGMGLEVAGSRSLELEWDKDSIAWAGLSAGGDSGSPVRIGQMPAVSNLTHGLAVTGLEPSAISWGTRVTRITSKGWQLVDSPLCA